MNALVWDSVTVIRPGEDADDPFAQLGVVGNEDVTDSTARETPPPAVVDRALIKWKKRLVTAVRRGDIDALRSLFNEDHVHGWIDTTERLLQQRRVVGMPELAWFETMETNVFLDAVGYDHERVLEFLFSSAQYERMLHAHQHNAELALFASVSLAKRRALGVMLRSDVYRALLSSTEVPELDTFALGSLLRRAAQQLAPPSVRFFVGSFSGGVAVSHTAPLDVGLPSELEQMEIVEDLIDAGGDVAPRYPRETSVLHCALTTEKTSRAQVQHWIAVGADVNGENEWGTKPLHQATDPEIIRMLLRDGSDVNALDSFSNPPLLRFLRRAKTAATFGATSDLDEYEKSVRILLKEGADPNSVSDEFTSALIVACSIEREAIVLELLCHHADVNHRNRDGDTALHVACEKNKWSSLVPLLMEYGADPTIQNHNGETPVDRARQATGVADKDKEKLLRLLRTSND